MFAPTRTLRLRRSWWSTSEVRQDADVTGCEPKPQLGHFRVAVGSSVTFPRILRVCVPPRAQAQLAPFHADVLFFWSSSDGHCLSVVSTGSANLLSKESRDRTRTSWSFTHLIFHSPFPECSEGSVFQQDLFATKIESPRRFRHSRRELSTLSIVKVIPLFSFTPFVRAHSFRT